MKQRIFILWASGNVGRELVKQIFEKDWIGFHTNPSVIVWVANSKNFIFDSIWIDKEQIKKIIESRESAINTLEKYWEKIEDLTDLLNYVKYSWLDWEVVFADVTALWTLSWTSNLALIETDILSETLPHIIKSRWAGLAVTACSIRVWIAKMLPNYIIS